MSRGRPRKTTVEAETPLLAIEKELATENSGILNMETEKDDLRNEEEKENKGQIIFVNMVRDHNWPEPHTATVHPDEVENYRIGGWVIK